MWVNATVTSAEFRQDGRLNSLGARSGNGCELSVSADEVVIAAGGVESTRLALLFDRANSGRLFSPRSPAGLFFHEHLSAHYATITVRDRRGLARLAGFRFRKDGMRNLRFELSAAARLREGLPAAYVQLLFGSEQTGPFDVLRDIYRGFQAKVRPSAKQIAFLSRHAPWLIRAAWTRFIRGRLLPPDDAMFALNLVVEQEPRADNRIGLSDEVDAYGVPLAAIDWRPSPGDVENFRAAAVLARSHWNAMGYDRFGTLEIRDEAEEEILHSGGCYHPGGTLRMGRDADHGAVDQDLRVFGSPNLWVASSAVFPRAGGANPTLTLIALALRLGDRLAR